MCITIFSVGSDAIKSKKLEITCLSNPIEMVGKLLYHFKTEYSQQKSGFEGILNGTLKLTI